VRSQAYGYGVNISRDCHFSHIVGHGGGLPGFGSYMMWLPDYGVGMFAMTNLTYAGPAAALVEAFEILQATGALQPRELPPSPSLVSTHDVITSPSLRAKTGILKPNSRMLLHMRSTAASFLRGLRA
jgi:hypothetical protein